MRLGERLKLLRGDLGISQEAMGAQGFISTPGWIKIEKGQRAPSDELIMKLISWLRKEQYVSTNAAGVLMDELLTLKYLGSRSFFVRKLAYNYAKELFADKSILVSEDSAAYRLKPRIQRRNQHNGAD